MGKQVTFYMLGRDEQEFEQFLLSQADAVLLGFASQDGKPVILEQFPAEDSPIVRYRTLYLWRPYFPLSYRPVLMKSGPLLGTTLYHVDAFQSSVVEVSRTVLLSSQNTATRGRLWAEMRREEGDHFVDKGREFHDWYESLAAWIRARCSKIGDRPVYYAGAEAIRWYQTGGQLQP